MQILNSLYEVEEIDENYVFEYSKRIIRNYVYSSWFDFLDYLDDCTQECALLFYTKIVPTYDIEKGVVIWAYLKKCYRRRIARYLIKQRLTRKAEDYDQLTYLISEIEYHNWQIENMDCAKFLTSEQLKICEYILHGFNYSEIHDFICPQNTPKDKKQPIYRRVKEIKQILSEIYNTQ